MTQSTPGPWTMDTKAGTIHYVRGPKGHGGNVLVVESLADARLIAQAPAMREALADAEAFLNRRPDDVYFPSTIRSRIRAILKGLEG